MFCFFLKKESNSKYYAINLLLVCKYTFLKLEKKVPIVGLEPIPTNTENTS